MYLIVSAQRDRIARAALHLYNGAGLPCCFETFCTSLPRTVEIICFLYYIVTVETGQRPGLHLLSAVW